MTLSKLIVPEDAPLERWPVSKLREDPNNRSSGQTEIELRAHGESLRTDGQVGIPWVTPDGQMITGNRTLLAARLVGLSDLNVRVAKLDEGQRLRLQLVENLMRVNITPYEEAIGFQRLQTLYPDATAKEVAALMKKDATWASRATAALQSGQETLQALKDGFIGLRDCAALARSPNEQRAELLAQRLAGATCESIERHVVSRKRQTLGQRQQRRVRRFKAVLPGSSVCVALSGTSLRIAEVIDALAELLKLARKAEKDRLDVKTFERVLRDQRNDGQKGNEAA